MLAISARNLPSGCGRKYTHAPVLPLKRVWHQGCNPASVVTTVDIQTVALSSLRIGPSAAACLHHKNGVTEIAALASCLGLPAEEIPQCVADARRWAETTLEGAARLGLHVIAARTPAYPERLWEIPDPPIVLWTKGAAVFHPRTVAIVGSRRATPTGLDVARKLGADLASAGWTVVSGMARGVDGAAHEGALDAGGETLAVLGCGADVVYPPEHKTLGARIAERGRILSEFPPGFPPMPWNFPLRNRIISGLARAVVVVEAGEKSGSLITARMAIEQGRDVLAVPGSAASGRYRGSHALIKDGARLVETVDDVLDELEGVSRERPQRTGDNRQSLSKLEETMAIGEPYSADDLAALAGRAAPELLAELGALEVQGRVRRVGGGNFVRLDAAASVRGIGT
jgi:DNA processing protein